jgi:hypothetical protein
VDHDTSIDFETNDPFRMQQFIVDPKTERYRIFLSQEPEDSWQILLFRSIAENPSSIKGNDLIRIRHTELNGYLSANLKYKLDFPE